MLQWKTIFIFILLILCLFTTLGTFRFPAYSHYHHTQQTYISSQDGTPNAPAQKRYRRGVHGNDRPIVVLTASTAGIIDPATPPAPAAPNPIPPHISRILPLRI